MTTRINLKTLALSTTLVCGLVTVGYSGGCLWAGDPDRDNELEALLIGASITFRTGFTGARQ